MKGIQSCFDNNANNSYVMTIAEDAGIGGTIESISSGAEAISTRYDCSLSPSHSPAMKKEKVTNIAPPTYFGLVSFKHEGMPMIIKLFWFWILELQRVT